MTSVSDIPVQRRATWMLAGTAASVVVAGLIIGVLIAWLLLDSRTTTPYRSVAVTDMPRGDDPPQAALAPVEGPPAAGDAAERTGGETRSPATVTVGTARRLPADPGLDGAAADHEARQGVTQAMAVFLPGRAPEQAVSNLIDSASQRRTVNQPGPPMVDAHGAGTPPAGVEPRAVTVSMVDEPPMPPVSSGPPERLPGIASTTSPAGLPAVLPEVLPEVLPPGLPVGAPAGPVTGITDNGHPATARVPLVPLAAALTSDRLIRALYPGSLRVATVAEPPQASPVDAASTDALLATLQREFPHPAGEGMAIGELLAPYPPIDKDSLTILTVSDSAALDTLFADHGFNWRESQESPMPVPRILVGAFPDDIVEVNQLEQRKRLFFNTVLPIILQVNESILADRARLAGIRAAINAGGEASAGEARFLADLSERYGVPGLDLDRLMRRVDVVPPSMALAQGAVESGWGTSTLARQGNALFGQITASPDGVLNAGQGFRFAAFDTLYDSVDAYALNLNTHPAYRDFRDLRAAMRGGGEVIDGYELMGTLLAYSELGEEYIAYVRRVMRANELMALDGLRLEEPEIAEASL